jgi:hypothetical protein
MNGKCYYLTTLGAWREHADRFATSHFIALTVEPQSTATPEVSLGLADFSNADTCHFATDATPILVLFEGDEGAHLTFEANSAVTPLPHPLAQKIIPENVKTALRLHGVPENATSFETAEILARVHPLLRHRVF